MPPCAGRQRTAAGQYVAQTYCLSFIQPSPRPIRGGGVDIGPVVRALSGGLIRASTPLNTNNDTKEACRAAYEEAPPSHCGNATSFPLLSSPLITRWGEREKS